MAITAHGVSSLSVKELLQKSLRIPHYQRPYCWEPATALQLVDDVKDALGDPTRKDVPYVLGAVILHEKDAWLDVVDGQQRILTLRMIIAILDIADALVMPRGGDNPVIRVWTALKRRFESLPEDDRRVLLDFIREHCQLVQVVTDDLDEAFRVFDSQNYRGKPLAPHDLLKAHHLREMRNETAAMKVAVVETWESVKDNDLDRLFSTYLYRIVRWSRGESAPGFQTHDIGIFKGISSRNSLSPNARYHLAAQAALPMLSNWGAWNGLGVREAERSRFQLDAPLPVGRPIFEMVSFMLGEIKELAKEAFGDEAKEFSLYDLNALGTADVLEERPSKSRYRYVAELYLAALLYYTNKFGDDDLQDARAKLFAWAYTLRIELLRVQFRSIDNRARGAGGNSSAFILLRNAASGRVVHKLPTSATPCKDGHEGPLVAVLKKGEV